MLLEKNRVSYVPAREGDVYANWWTKRKGASRARSILRTGFGDVKARIFEEH